MLENILPPAVCGSQSSTDRLDAALFPEEQVVVAGAVARRKAEFTTVRACARDALATLGHAPVPLVPGEYGAPSWPDHVVGSMTHCPGYRAAAVAHSADVVTLGIDAEPHEALPGKVLRAVARPEELDMLAGLPAAGGVAWDRLLFSAKESVYKAWFPVARRWLGFQQATIVIVPDGTFTARLHTRGPHLLGRPLTGFHGRWATSGGHVATAITVERNAPRPARNGGPLPADASLAVESLPRT
ncbi:4'-phosphopantetheinyl transferase superfamily protein [Streptomyces sp. DSM 42041]|uniref:4'-phosphopantetheinyl transferase superfamily protein n=1 Tax=Streptomyces hazeniae TaxID=3075538 RepID=A0ABU2NXP6_9ACTN|nr:4'-phosphopantetheinyl transferase superfamily protein [Streptomyces sp. DSM 42041]MDT0380948.1 4'-phosphopantetheinyl transferase superfamily protein [Streptomyces sp. DSM 42041]